MPVIGALLGIWAVLLLQSASEWRDAQDLARTQLGLSVSILADANAVAEKEADTPARISEIRTAALQKALLQFPKASIWLESNGAILAGAPPVGDLGDFIVVDEKRDTFTVHAVLPLDAISHWTRAEQIRFVVVIVVSIVFLVMTGFLARALRQRAGSDAVLSAINDSAALLMSEQDLDTALVGVLATVGPTANITRVHLAKVIVMDAKHVITTVRHEWFAPGMVPLASFERYLNLDTPNTVANIPDAIAQKFIGRETKYYSDDFPEPSRSLDGVAGLRSILSVAVLVDGRYYGSLVFSDASPRRRQWTQGDINTLKTLARLISAAATRAYHIEQRAKTQSILSAINDSAALLVGEQDLDTAITRVLATVGPTIGVTRVFLAKMISMDDDRTITSVLHEWFGPGMIPLVDDPDYQNQETPSVVLASKPDAATPIFIGRENIYFSDNFPEPQKSRSERVGLRSILSLAIMIDGEFYGSLIFADASPEKRQWNQGDIDTLRTLARLISAAATRAHYIALRAKTESILNAINESAALLMGELDVDKAINRVLAMVGPTVGVTRAFMTTVTTGGAGPVINGVSHEWFAPEMAPLLDIPFFREMGTRPNASTLAERQSVGRESQHYADDLPEPHRSQHINVDIRSILALTIMVDDKYYGSLVFADSSPKRRQWNQGDIDTLKTLARLISTAATRAKHIAQREQAISGLRLRDRALEGISQGVTISDDRAPGTPIIYTNPAFAASSRYAMDEVIGRGLLSFFDAGVAPRILDRMAQANAAKKPWRMETSLKRKDGTSFVDSMVTTMIIDQNGNSTHSVTIHEDVTEIRQREELLLEAQKMESVGQLTGGIAHDFNNLLTAIKSNAEDLRDDLSDNPMLQSQAEIVLEAADRGAGLVAQLMAFARKQELQPKVTDVNELLDRFAKLLRSSVPAHIEIELRKGEKLPGVYIDPGRLETAILNLAMNARDAMPEGGTITIETALKKLDADYVAEHIEVQQGDYVRIAITDTGTGMARDVADRAFVPFFTTKEVGKGTGLGLSMVYGFVKQSGGHAMIYSELGLGTVVKIYLPAMNQSEPSDGPSPTTDKIDVGARRILLVEDDPIVRQSIKGKLIRLGYQVVAASNALEAIEVLKKDPHFDLVFSDVVMPGPMNGADLVREVRRRWPDINVLLTSGYTESTVLGKINLPADVKLLSKPYSNSELARVIDEAISLSSGATV